MIKYIPFLVVSAVMIILNVVARIIKNKKEKELLKRAKRNEYFYNEFGQEKDNK